MNPHELPTAAANRAAQLLEPQVSGHRVLGVGVAGGVTVNIAISFDVDHRDIQASTELSVPSIGHPASPIRSMSPTKMDSTQARALAALLRVAARQVEWINARVQRKRAGEKGPFR